MALMRFSKEQALTINAIHNNFAINENRLFEQNSAQIALLGNAAQQLPKDFFGQWASEGIEVMRDELVIGSALDITRSIDMGLYSDYFMTISDSGDVNKSIDGQSQAKGDQAQFEYHGTPIGITDSTAVFGWKQMKAATNKGFNLTLPTLRNNQRKVAESLELDILNGSGIKFGDAEGFGFRNAPQRGRVATGVTIQSLDGKGAKAMAVKIMTTLHTKKFFGAVKVFMNYQDFYYLTTTDYSDLYPSKRAIDGFYEALPANSIVIPSANIDVDETITVCNRRDVYEVLNGMPMSTIPTVRHGVMDPYEFRVIASQALQLKYDANGNAGYVHAKKAMPAL